MIASTFVRLRTCWKHLRRARRRLWSSDRCCYAARVQWWHDQSWAEPYLPFLQRDAINGHPPTRILDRRFQLAQLAGAVAGLRGSTAECGVFRGVGSGVICQTLAGTYQEGEYHLGFDSWDGVSEPEAADRMADGTLGWKRGQLRTPMSETQELLSVFPFCKLTQGWIPQCFAGFESHQFRLVHVDVDLRQPTWGSLAFFYPRMVSGGVIVLDDHGFIDCPGARSAAIEFFADKPETIIEAPTGQAFVFKR
jgi:O-methyltransferase